MRRSFIEAVKQDPNVDLSTIQSGASGFGIPDLKRESGCYAQPEPLQG